MRLTLPFLLTLTLLSGFTSIPASAAPLQQDRCHAAALQSFIGKPKDKLPANLPQGTRVLCSICAATMDYNPTRLNVIYDADTEIVQQIRCG